MFVVICYSSNNKEYRIENVLNKSSKMYKISIIRTEDGEKLATLKPLRDFKAFLSAVEKMFSENSKDIEVQHLLTTLT